MGYADYFSGTKMPRDLHGFAEKAIEIAGQSGERKRRYGKEIEEMLAASRMAEIKRLQTGETKRRGMIEAGLGERLKKTQEFARPGQEAATERVRYETEFEKGARGTIEDILKSKAAFGRTSAEEAALGLSEGRREISLRDEAETEAEAATAVSAPEVLARPERKMRPDLKRMLWEGTPTKTGFTLPGLGAPVYGYKNIADWLEGGMQKGYDWAFPRGK